MSGTGRTVYIAGAGIAGLTLALALAKFGASVVVLERNKQSAPSISSASTRPYRPAALRPRASTSFRFAPESRW
jgi:2-polyprenyl-6-methoxyphenol hydroxylase-like FAD-dependent oxidoreductase